MTRYITQSMFIVTRNKNVLQEMKVSTELFSIVTVMIMVCTDKELINTRGSEVRRPHIVGLIWLLLFKRWPTQAARNNTSKCLTFISANVISTLPKHNSSDVDIYLNIFTKLKMCKWIVYLQGLAATSDAKSGLLVEFMWPCYFRAMLQRVHIPSEKAITGS